ncbi:MAG: lytic transglycosylase domain-containing protein [Kiritimatiellae bacterium]|nr:lytic transglycosylase domain-containing protein [Kiritimatiellia bacterium]
MPKPRLAQFFAAALACVFGIVQSAEAQELQLQSLWQQGLDLADEHLADYGYEVDREALAGVPRLNEALQFLDGVDDALENGTLEQLAQMKPTVEASIQWLEQWPAAEPYTAWLRQQMDYFDVAEESVAESRDVPAQTVPPPRPLSLPPAPAPASPTAHKKAEQTARSAAMWEKRMAHRAAPSGAAALVPKLKPIFRKSGLPEELVWLAEVESGFKPHARSPVGAVGLFQFMAPTARRFGLNPERPDERLDPEKSASAAAAYLRILHRRFGSWPLALAAYNAGEGRVSKALKTAQVSSFEEIADILPLETRMYVPKIDAVIQKREGTRLTQLPAPR